MARQDQGFVFLAGDLALDFVNTVMVDGDGLLDAVATPERLASWVSESGLGAEFGTPAEIPRRVHAATVGLRDALKTGFAAVAAGDPVPAGALAAVNAVLRSGPGTELVATAPGELVRRVPVDLARDATPLPWLLADAGARLLTGDQVRRVRRCANHDTCVLLFLDTSRSHTRRWCSMELCGNRSKVAAHGARARRARAAGPA